jgi:DNA-binding beta-propeller fold protein YncE
MNMKRRGILTYLSVTVLAVSLSAALMNSPLSAQSRKGSRLHPPIVGPADIDGFSSPIRIAFGPAGTLLVTDYNLEMVAYVDPQTNVIKGGFPVDGRPLGVVYARKRIFVGNETKACISVFSEEGTWLEDITGGALGPITMPTDLAVDSSTNELFVLDFGARAVKVFLLNGKERGTIPPTLPDPTALTTPTALALDPLRLELLVSDYGGLGLDGETIRPRIQVFDYDGALLRTMSSYVPGGMMGGSYIFSRPQGLQVDSLGQVVLTDCYSGEVLIISRDTGAVLKTLGGYGVDPGEMRLPLDLVMDDVSKDIFVTNNLLKRIEIFRQGGIY